MNIARLERLVLGALALPVFLVLAATAASDDSARELTWDDLLPDDVIRLSDETIAIRREMRKLTREDRDAYRDVAQELYLREQVESGVVAEEDLSSDARKLLADRPSARNEAAVAYWQRLDAKRKELDEVAGQLDTGLAGQRIRMPGYMLPLDFEGSLVREFLLVPYLGACIHSPPPPPNQIVHVRSADGFNSEELYTPVWIEGTLSLEGKTSDLTYIDGSAAVDAGYSMSDAQVEPYTE